MRIPLRTPKVEGLRPAKRKKGYVPEPKPDREKNVKLSSASKKPVMDLVTSIVYDSRQELCESLNLKPNRISEKIALYNGIKNDTPFRYIKFDPCKSECGYYKTDSGRSFQFIHFVKYFEEEVIYCSVIEFIDNSERITLSLSETNTYTEWKPNF